MKFTDLSQPQQFAMIDVVSRGGLYRMPCGYDGSMTHTHQTMLALHRRGLVFFRPRSGPMGAVERTKAGLALVVDRFGPAAHGASVALLNATPKRRGQR